MKSFFIVLLLLLLATSSYLIYDKKDYSKSEVKIFKSLINSSLEDLASILKQDAKALKKKLQDANIKVLNTKQSITQIALLNTKESSYIIDLITQ